MFQNSSPYFILNAFSASSLEAAVSYSAFSPEYSLSVLAFCSRSFLNISETLYPTSVPSVSKAFVSLSCIAAANSSPALTAFFSGSSMSPTRDDRTLSADFSDPGIFFRSSASLLMAAPQSSASFSDLSMSGKRPLMASPTRLSGRYEARSSYAFFSRRSWLICVSMDSFSRFSASERPVLFVPPSSFFTSLSVLPSFRATASMPFMSFFHCATLSSS